jgi:hypothetical protein
LTLNGNAREITIFQNEHILVMEIAFTCYVELQYIWPRSMLPCRPGKTTSNGPVPTQVSPTTNTTTSKREDTKGPCKSKRVLLLILTCFSEYKCHLSSTAVKG